MDVYLVFGWSGMGDGFPQRWDSKVPFFTPDTGFHAASLGGQPTAWYSDRLPYWEGRRCIHRPSRISNSAEIALIACWEVIEGGVCGK